MQQSAGAAAGIAFTGCGLLDAAHAQPAGKRRQVVVAGKRVKTVDVHAHCVIPEAMSLMGMKIAPQTLVVVQDRLRIMDEQGIDVEALSINPFWYGAERDKVAELIKIQNEKLAEICAANPDRFVAFASLALQFPDLAVQQLEEAVKSSGCVVQPSAAALPEWNLPIRNFTRCGQRRRNSACCYLFIRRACRC